jgi:hypothetical protein
MSELTLIILSIALIGMVCLPLIFGYFKQKNISRALKSRLKSEADVTHLRDGDFDTWREAYCLGLDQLNGKLLFLNVMGEDSNVQKIELDQVRLCRPIRNFREVIEGKERRQIIYKISLVLDLFDEDRKPFEVELYDEDKSDYIVNEWELAQTWSKKVNDFRN